MGKGLAEGGPAWEGVKACQLVARALHYLSWRALTATPGLPSPSRARFPPRSLLSPQLLKSVV